MAVVEEEEAVDVGVALEAAEEEEEEVIRLVPRKVGPLPPFQVIRSLSTKEQQQCETTTVCVYYLHTYGGKGLNINGFFTTLQ